MTRAIPICAVPPQLLWNPLLRKIGPQVLCWPLFQNKRLKVPLDAIDPQNTRVGACPPVSWRACPPVLGRACAPKPAVAGRRRAAARMVDGQMCGLSPCLVPFSPLPPSSLATRHRSPQFGRSAPFASRLRCRESRPPRDSSFVFNRLCNTPSRKPLILHRLCKCTGEGGRLGRHPKRICLIFTPSAASRPRQHPTRMLILRLRSEPKGHSFTLTQPARRGGEEPLMEAA